MKKIFFAIALVVLVGRSFANSIIKDTLPDSYGWMIFVDEETVIWVPAAISEKTKPSNFFKTSIYENGLDIKAFIGASQFKAIAKMYDVEFGSTNRKGKVAVIPVKVKRYKSSDMEGSDVLIWAFTKDGHHVTVKYQFAASYYTGEISLIKKCDKRRYKKSKRKLLHTL
jgi:hypothetical protein